MKRAVMTQFTQQHPPPKLKLPQVKLIHRPQNTTQTIQDREKATDLLLGLRLYLQNKSTN